MLVVFPARPLTYHVEKRPPLPEVDSQIGRQDRLLQHPEHARVLFRRYIRQELIAGRVQDHQALIEMVVFHRGRRVQLGERRRRFDLERIVGTSVVQVVTEAGDHQRQTLDLAEDVPPLRRLDQGQG